jgi:hypothetical protein
VHTRLVDRRRRSLCNVADQHSCLKARYNLRSSAVVYHLYPFLQPTLHACQEMWRLRQEESRAHDTFRHALDPQLTHLDGTHNLHGVYFGLKG